MLTTQRGARVAWRVLSVNHLTVGILSVFVCSEGPVRRPSRCQRLRVRVQLRWVWSGQSRFFSFLTVTPHLCAPQPVVWLVFVSCRNWTLQSNGIFTEPCPCWRRKTRRSTRKMQSSTHKVMNAKSNELCFKVENDEQRFNFIKQPSVFEWQRKDWTLIHDKMRKIY